VLRPLPKRTFKQLTAAERTIIRRMRSTSTVTLIAKVLEKHPSTVSRELRRNADTDGLYLDAHADAYARRRRTSAKSKGRIIENDLQLEAYVERLLAFGLSPEQIAGYMLRSGHPRPVSYRTVYRWVRRAWQGRKKYLRYRGKPRALYGSRKNDWDPGKRHISERPRMVETRERVGDWEADIVHGTQDDSRHCLLTLNDRATGFCIIRKLQAIDSHTVALAIIDALSVVPVETITCDNGVEFGRHKLI
jgi:IS30 family transposase